MKENVYLVIGLGTFGMQLCEELSSRNARVIAVDNRGAQIEKIKNSVTQAILLDTTNEENFSTLPFDDVDTAIIAIGDNIESNILTTALLKKAGVPYIIARASTELHMQVLMQVGADEVLNVEKQAGRQLAEKISASWVLDSVPLTRDISIAEVNVPATFTGRRLDDIDLPGKMDLIVSAIKRSGVQIDEEGSPNIEEQVVFPLGETVLQEGDILIVAGKNDRIDALRAL